MTQDNEKSTFEEIQENVAGSIESNIVLGDDPTEDEIREYVQMKKEQGLNGQQIGQQIGVMYLVKKQKDVLDTLEEVLTEEFENYGN